MLIGREGEQRLRFWLEELVDDSPTEFRTEDSEEGPSEEAIPPVTIRHPWGKGRTQYFWEGQDGSPPQRVILSSSGVRKHEIQLVVMDKWTSLPKEISQQIAKLNFKALPSSRLRWTTVRLVQSWSKKRARRKSRPSFSR